MRRIILLAIACVLLMGLSLSGCGPGPPVGTFPDERLETAIREALYKAFGRIYASDLGGLASLSAEDWGIQDLSGLQYCTNLTDLDLGVNQISDISLLANLTNLTDLDLGSNQISDISPLANLTNLTDLDLDSNQISDISPLVENAGLSEGDHVILHENPLSSDSINIYIPQLTARGVDVYY